jgi:DNA-binding HxlR family transcriptional regulator
VLEGAHYDSKIIDDFRTIMSGTWKVKILMFLFSGTKRFGEILRGIYGISQPILSKYLDELERWRLITRKAYPEIPPRVEYSLTESGERYVLINQQIETWYLHHFNDYDNALIKKKFGGVWKSKILMVLYKTTCRFGVLRNKLQDISPSELARHLKALENDGMIQRIIYAEIPPKVEYSLTEKAEEYVLILEQCLEWSINHQRALLESYVT